jgi:hypothetical protein
MVEREEVVLHMEYLTLIARLLCVPLILLHLSLVVIGICTGTHCESKANLYRNMQKSLERRYLMCMQLLLLCSQMLDKKVIFANVVAVIL